MVNLARVRAVSWTLWKVEIAAISKTEFRRATQEARVRVVVEVGVGANHAAPDNHCLTLGHATCPLLLRDAPRLSLAHTPVQVHGTVHAVEVFPLTA